MSDKKNSPNANLEANLAKIANTKPRKRMRNDNIYERFITRVENVDGTEDGTEDDATFKESALKPLKNANKLSSYEPLSDSELALFAAQAQDEQQERASLQKSKSASGGITIDFSDEDEDFPINKTAIVRTKNASTFDADNSEVNNTKKSVHAIDSNEADDLTRQDLTKPITKKVRKAKNEQFENQPLENTEAVDDRVIAKSLAKSNKKQPGSKKPLIIGMIFGSLSIAAIVMTLIFTGVLSTSTKSDGANDAEIPATADDDPIASTKPSVVETIEQDTQLPAGSSTAETTSVQSTGDAVANQNQGVVDGSEAQSATQPSNDEPADAPITYEDFRQESQSTLYRETND